MRERERGGARAPERARVGSFWWSRREGVFETRERERGGARAPERARVGTFWWSRWGGVPEHQNEPMWARSGVRDEGEGEGTGSFWCSRRGRGRGEVREHQNEPVWARSGGQDGEGCTNIRTSPCGLVLMLETRERKSGGARAPERATHGLVLVFKMRERERGGA